MGQGVPYTLKTPRRAEMRDESAKSKIKPPNPIAFVVQVVPGLLTTLLGSYGLLAKIQNPWRRRRRLPGSLKMKTENAVSPLP